MKDWLPSDLMKDELLQIPKELFIEPSKAIQNLLYTKYIGETDAGIMVECGFRPSVGQTEPATYRMFLNWASIFCGHIKVYRQDGSLLRAKLKQKPSEVFVKKPLTNE